MKNFFDKKIAGRWGMTPSLVKLTAFLLVGFCFVPLLLQDSDSFHRFLGSYVTQGGKIFPFTRTSGSSLSGSSLKQLIDDIREAVKVAANGSNISFSDADRLAWEEHFPCRSRVELDPLYEKRKHVQYTPVNQQWQQVLDEYAILHRVCMSKVGNLEDYFSSQNSSTGCKFVVAEAHFGLGNKVLHISSMFMYAVLTQRVLLIPTSTSVPPIFCEPFPGSSWSMADDIHRLLKGNRGTSDQLYAAIDESLLTNRSMTIYASQGGIEWGPERRFFCDTEQEHFSQVTWLTFDGCLHSLPELFAIAKFRPVLEEIFPQRIVLTHVLRTVMLPADSVWERVIRVKKVHLYNADKQVGVQVRFLHGEKQYVNDNLLVNKNIVTCMWKNDFLPEVCPETTSSDATLADGRFANCSSSASDTDTPPAVTKVLIASLFLGFHDYLKDIYLSHETVQRETVGIVQLTHEKTQGRGVDVDGQALVEIITLSLSDVLLVTPFSTFGGLAQAYGSLVPYFIEFKGNEPAPCQRGLSTEPCYLGARPDYDCRHDSPQQKNVVDVVPYLQRCMYIDVGPGYSMQIMNKE